VNGKMEAAMAVLCAIAQTGGAPPDDAQEERRGKRRPLPILPTMRRILPPAHTIRKPSKCFVLKANIINLYGLVSRLEDKIKICQQERSVIETAHSFVQDDKKYPNGVEMTVTLANIWKKFSAMEKLGEIGLVVC